MTEAVTTHTLALHDISKSYDTVEVLKDISLNVSDGEFVVLLGPSGCGKSTLLHAIAGLHPINAGRIEIAGRDVSNVQTRDRDVAMVFQSYALYPNMTVADNIGFPLKMRKLSKGQIRDKVAEVAAVLQLEALLERFPRQLSGGQRQRVAIGRSLVRDPKVFLFDEPLSNLDATLRVDMRAEIKALHQRIGKTMVYVTHDQIEAMTLATKIVILSAGQIQQVGTPHAVYHDPANLFVAKFIGSPAISLLECHVGGPSDQSTLVIGKGKDQVVFASRNALDQYKDRRMLIGLRPEHISLSGTRPVSTPATVKLIEPTGPEDIVSLNLAGQPVTARFPTGAVRQDQSVDVALDLSSALYFDAVSGERLHPTHDQLVGLG